jgi:hypothetical protein
LKFAVVIVKPTPLMFAHSFSFEFVSFIWKLYSPLSSGVTLRGEQVDCAAAIRELPVHIAIAANPIAAHFNFFIGFISFDSPAESSSAHADSGSRFAPHHGWATDVLSAWASDRSVHGVNLNGKPDPSLRQALRSSSLRRKSPALLRGLKAGPSTPRFALRSG